VILDEMSVFTVVTDKISKRKQTRHRRYDIGTKLGFLLSWFIFFVIANRLKAFARSRPEESSKIEDKKPGLEQILYEGEVMQQIAAETVLACTVEQTTTTDDHEETDVVGDDDGLASQESLPSCTVCRR
jgi:hypothetical protein